MSRDIARDKYRELVYERAPSAPADSTTYDESAAVVDNGLSGAQGQSGHTRAPECWPARAPSTSNRGATGLPPAATQETEPVPRSQPKSLPPSLRRYLFASDTMQTIVSGKSALDLAALRLTNRDEAARFLARYGYDLANPVHSKDLERVRSEAFGFLRGVLMPGIGDLQLPSSLDELPIIDLLMLAAQRDVSTPTDALRGAWACTVLRVMHTVAHADNYFQNAFYPQIREAILSRFVEQVDTRADGSLVLRGRSYDVPLVRFVVKETKPLRSVVLKLLQKEENVAYDLFDHIGVRLIVARPIDALFAVRALRETHTIMYPNIKPTRSRNTLIEFDEYTRTVQGVLESFVAGELSELQAVAAIESFNHRPSTKPQLDWNPYSSPRYNSIQFTCRQMIRFRNPLHERLDRAREIAHRTLAGDALAELLAALDPVGVEEEIQFFFPYEVQVMDIASYEEATVGRAAYADYKQRQIRAARVRVMRRVLELAGREDVLTDAPAAPAAPRLLPLRQMRQSGLFRVPPAGDLQVPGD